MLKKLQLDKVSFSLVCILLVLRFPLIFIGEFGFVDSNICIAVFLIGTYLCTGIFICKNLSTLDQYCISVTAIVIFLCSPFLTIGDFMSDPTVVIKIPMAIAFAYYIYAHRKSLCTVKGKGKDAVINIAFTVVMVAVLTLLFAYIRGYKGVTDGDPFSIWMLTRSLAFQLSFAAVMEEPLFRGFIWGVLRRFNLKDIWVCVAQALLFWIGHLYYINTGLNFWLVIPLASLGLGLIIVKTKSITYSMSAHALLNTLGDIFQHYVKLF